MSSNNAGDSTESPELSSSESDTSEGVGLRPSGALSSGRTVKEIDEQLSSLKKENFNLKLRIYFLEEGMGSNFSAVKEDLMKKYIELQVELANLQKELENKQELLCQAAKAMEIEEEENKKEISIRDQEIHDLKDILEQIQYQLKNERQELKQVALCAEAFDLNSEEDDSLDIIKKLQVKIQELQDELKNERDRTGHCNMMADNVREKCKLLEMQVEQKNGEIASLTTEVKRIQDKLTEFNKRAICLEDTLSDKNILLEETSKKMFAKDEELRTQKIALEDLNKMYCTLLEDRSKLEKRVEKYKWQCCISEKKNDELATHVDTLKIKIQNLEMKLASSMENVKKNETRINPRNSDGSSKISSSKTSSPLKYTKSHSPSNNALFCDADEGVSAKTSRNDTHHDVLTHEEIVELKKNHFKACKIIKGMIQKKKEYVDQIEKLQKSVTDKGDEIKNLKKKITDMSDPKPCISGDPKKKSIKDKVSELNLTASLNPSAAKENTMAEDDNDMELSERYKELANELEEKIEILNATIAEKDLQIERFKMDVQEKTDRLIDLEFELLTLSNGVDNKKDSIEENETKILRLETELRKRTVDLQGIVNKELWEKNRTIEKLQTLIKTKDETVSKLEKSHSNKDLQLKLLKDKINELGVHINLPPELLSTDQFYDNERAELVHQIEQLKQQLRNVPEHENDKQIERLQSQCEHLRADLSKSEKLRQEEREICSILNNRLEELCQFLQTLLRHKSVFGFLGNEQSRQLQQALDKSLEFSHILSNSISHGAEESLMEQSAITSFLNSTRNDSISFTNLIDDENVTLSIIPKDVTLTYRSHLNRINNESDVIGVLRQQIANLKHEIEVRDVELERVRNEGAMEVGDLEKLHPRKKDTNQSESESWSEPDRSVSLARMGLEDESLKRPNARRRCNGEAEASSESTEDDKNHSKTPSKRVTLAESRQTIIALHEQICELEASIKQKDNQLIAIQRSHYETEKILKLEQDKLQSLMDENRKLELDNAATQKVEFEERIIHLNGVIESLEEFKRTTLADNSVKDKEMQNTLNEMEIERGKLVETSKNLENALEKVKIDLKKAQTEVKRVCAREEQVRQQLEEREETFSKQEEEHKVAVEALQKELEVKLIEVKEYYEKECVAESEMKVVQLKKEMDYLQATINKDLQRIRTLEEKINDLHKELNKANLQYSEVVLEKSKMKNENAALQNTVQKLLEQEALLNKELKDVTYKCSKQLSDLENKNLVINTQLNDLRKGHVNRSLPSSLPSNLSTFSNSNITYRRQVSDHSGYVSEDVPIEQIEQHRILDIIGQNMIPLDAGDDQDRLNATASPDLGIESDQGRFSSLEANVNVPRPFLAPLEIAQNMNDLLDPVEDVSCGNEECCKKAKQIANENIDLRKRLLRTRRALEDTLHRLTVANKQKKEVEKSICKQIFKTSQVLRKAKANLDSGSEADIKS
ncbi:hypothetical protein FQR65_LT07390 [Abscondita terminalis]|nr:hypothetical protein FQR65_LT07390 [Abscondita terminalis]